MTLVHSEGEDAFSVPTEQADKLVLAPKHTTGPWVARGRFIGTPNHMSFIAECRDQNGNWSDEPMAVANARLIGAAPDLLEALADLFASYKELADSGDAGFWALEDTDEGKRAMAAIAKATGADQ